MVDEKNEDTMTYEERNIKKWDDFYREQEVMRMENIRLQKRNEILFRISIVLASLAFAASGVVLMVFLGGMS